jgi:hypothetical protein
MKKMGVGIALFIVFMGFLPINGTWNSMIRALKRPVQLHSQPIDKEESISFWYSRLLYLFKRTYDTKPQVFDQKKYLKPSQTRIATIRK